MIDSSTIQKLKLHRLKPELRYTEHIFCNVVPYVYSIYNEEYNDMIYYKYEGDYIFEYNTNTNLFQISHELFFTKFNLLFDYKNDFDKCFELIKQIATKQLKLHVRAADIFLSRYEKILPQYLELYTGNNIKKYIRPCDCFRSKTINMLQNNDYILRDYDYKIEVTNVGTILTYDNLTVKFDTSTFKAFAEWYLKEQPIK